MVSDELEGFQTKPLGTDFELFSPKTIRFLEQIVSAGQISNTRVFAPSTGYCICIVYVRSRLITKLRRGKETRLPRGSCVISSVIFSLVPIPLF